MLLRWLLAALHLLALAIGTGAVVIRAAAFRDILDTRGIRRALSADNWWGLAAFLWLGTGLARLLLGTEKPTEYYLASPLFWAKMTTFAIILVLELGPMITLMQWRGALRRGETPNIRNAPRYAVISTVEAFLVVVMVFLATALARGFEGLIPR